MTAAATQGAKTMTTTCAECETRIRKGKDEFDQPVWLDVDGMPCSEQPAFHDHEPAAPRKPVFVEATDRDETEPCEAGTVGCSVDHRSTTDDPGCQPW